MNDTDKLKVALVKSLMALTGHTWPAEGEVGDLVIMHSQLCPLCRGLVSEEEDPLQVGEIIICGHCAEIIIVTKEATFREAAVNDLTKLSNEQHSQLGRLLLMARRSR